MRFCSSYLVVRAVKEGKAKELVAVVGRVPKAEVAALVGLEGVNQE